MSFLSMLSVFVFIAIAIFLLTYRKKLSSKRLVNWSYIASIFASLVSLISVIFLVVSYETQREQFERQQFEQTFFNMLNNLSDIVASMEVRKHEYKRDTIGIPQDEYDLQGIRCFDMMIKLSSWNSGRTDHFDTTSTYPMYENPFEIFLQYNISVSLLLEFVEESNLPERDKQTFFSMILEPMGFYQKCALIYHIALCDRNNPINIKLRELERKRKFFKNGFPKDLRWTGSMNEYILYETGVYNPKDDPRLNRPTN